MADREISPDNYKSSEIHTGSIIKKSKNAKIRS